MRDDVVNCRLKLEKILNFENQSLSLEIKPNYKNWSWRRNGSKVTGSRLGQPHKSHTN
jgi:hypothetical protein